MGAKEGLINNLRVRFCNYVWKGGFNSEKHSGLDLFDLHKAKSGTHSWTPIIDHPSPSRKTGSSLLCSRCGFGLFGYVFK